MNDVSLRTNSASPTATQPSRASGNAREIDELVAEMMLALKPPEISPDVFVSGACTMFASFPIEACRAVADPGTGYPSTEQFAPTLAALRLALEIASRPHLLRREREARSSALAKQRAAEQRDTGPRPGYAELQRRCAALGLPIGEPRRRKPIDAAAESARVRERYGIAQQAWDAVPRVSE